jgi:hypothetical protein
MGDVSGGFGEEMLEIGFLGQCWVSR